MPAIRGERKKGCVCIFENIGLDYHGDSTYQELWEGAQCRHTKLHHFRHKATENENGWFLILNESINSNITFVRFLQRRRLHPLRP